MSIMITKTKGAGADPAIFKNWFPTKEEKRGSNPRTFPEVDRILESKPGNEWE